MGALLLSGAPPYESRRLAAPTLNLLALVPARLAAVRHRIAPPRVVALDWRDIVQNLCVLVAYVFIMWVLILIGDLTMVSWLIKDAGALSSFP